MKCRAHSILLTKKSLRILSALLLVFLSITGFSQQYNTYLIDYSTLSSIFNSSGCNIFPAPTKVSGYNHQAVVGFPRYYSYTDASNTVDKVLALDASYSSSLGYDAGTAVDIAFPFKLNRNYVISANVSGRVPNDGFSSLSFLGLWMGVKNGSFGLNASTTCTGPQQFTPPPTYTFGTTGIQDLYINNVIMSFACTSALTDMLLAGHGYEGQGTIFVKSVTIRETKDFTLSPAKVTIHCGSYPATTFSVGNPSNVGNITQYVWNLGASNTWLYNGAPAPTTITTNTGSLQLTPVTGTTAPTNVSVTVYVNGGVYNTATTTAVYDNQVSALSITGSPTLTSSIPPSGNTYSVSSLPAGATVSWTASPAGMATLASNGNSVTVTPVLNASGIVTLTATLTDPCGATGTSNLPIALKNGCDLIRAPAALTATYGHDGGVTLSWDAQPGITGYQLQFTYLGLTDVLHNDVTTTNSYVYHNQSESLERYSVEAYCSSGSSSYWSNWDTFSVQQPCPFASISGVSVSGNQLAVSLIAAPGGVSYNLNFNVQGTNTNILVPNAFSVGENPYIFTGDYNTTYVVTAQAICPAGSGGNTAWSSPVTVTTTAPPPCNAPTIGEVEPSSNMLYVFWTPSVGAINYNLRFTNVSTGVADIVSNLSVTAGQSTGEYIYTGQHNAIYQVAVQSNCTAGQSNWVNYYQTIHTTNSGNDADSRTVTNRVISGDSANNALKLFPVPAFGQVTVAFTTVEKAKAELYLTTVSGSILFKKSVNAVAGINIYPINIADLSNGIYFMKLIEDNGNVFVKKLLVGK